MPGTLDRVVTFVATQLIQATAHTADGVSERVLAQLVERSEVDGAWFLRPANNGNYPGV